MTFPGSSIAEQIWDAKYRWKSADGTPIDLTIGDTWARVAKAAAAAEPEDRRGRVEAAFLDALDGFAFLPAGRILSGAGTGRRVTLFNCFVMGTIEDDLGRIFDHLREGAVTMQQGGGIGFDFSTLRPKGAPVAGVGADASGPVSFMDVWDAMCRTIMSAGSRRGAMMGVMRCDHPDIEDFVAAKADPGRLRMFNLSVLVTDPFVAAVKRDADWPLLFEGKSYRTVRARELWDRIMRATYDYAEPGVIFIDRINAANNLAYCEHIAATNPCGEQPLPPYGACLLGSINLAQLVEAPFTDKAQVPTARLEALTATAVRVMDNVIDVSNYPLPAQAHEAKTKRRIGLGVTGLADALIMMRARYGSPASLSLIDAWLGTISRAAYIASTDLAREKGAFPLFDRERFLAAPLVARHDPEVREAIARYGIRNGLLTSIAPTGTISLFADNVSSGIEPVFSLSYTRRILNPDGSHRTEEISDYAYRMYVNAFGPKAELPDYFVTAQTLTPEDHLAVQAAAQTHVDSSISKTINCPESIGFEAFKSIYLDAYDRGLKGCTTFRPNPVTGSVLSISEAPAVTVPATAPVRASPVSATDSIVYMTQPLARPQSLGGMTYKVRWPESDHAIYITINDILQDGRRRPFEIFINSKNMEHYAWTVALTRMISAVFRRGGDVAFVVEELKAVFDPRGGQWMGGRYVPSLLAAIGGIIEEHLIAIGFLSPPRSADDGRPARQPVVRAAADGEPEPAFDGGVDADGDEALRELTTALPGRSCPKCGMPTLIRAEGCERCLSCDYSRCA